MLNKKRQKCPAKKENVNLALIFTNLEYYNPKYQVILGRGLVENKGFYFSKRTLPDHTQLVTKKALFVNVGLKFFRI